MKKIIIISLCILSVLSLIAYFFRDEITPNMEDVLSTKPSQYYGATVDMSQILPESQHYIKNSKGEDLIDIAAKLGMNTLRITNITSPTDGKDTTSYSQGQWKEVLDKMREKRIYAVILIEANGRDEKFHNNITLDDYYINFVKNYVAAKECNYSNVLAVDISNEPLLNSQNLEKLREATKIVKSACPNTKITIGSWRTDSGQKDDSGQPIYNWHDPKETRQINDIVDIQSVHLYGFDKPKDGPYPDPYKLTTGYLNEIRKYTNKPVLIEEFGAGNGSALTDQNTLGSRELQKTTYEGVLKAVHDYKNKNIIGATAYLLLPRSDGTDSWSIATDNGDNLLPAAYTFRH